MADGAPAHNLIGTDLQQGFIDLGYDLFRDRETLMSKFFVSDILGNDASPTELNGKLDIIHASSFFHLFPLSKQTEIAKRLVKLLRPVPGSLILGRQTGNVKPGEYKHGSHDQTGMWRHDASSWEEMWRAVGLNTGSVWRVEANLESTQGFTKRDGENEMAWRNEGDRGLRFEVWRL